jgi:hypothetical protein
MGCLWTGSTDGEVPGVSGGVDDATDQPVVVLTLRPNTNSGRGHVNYSLHPTTPAHSSTG